MALNQAERTFIRARMNRYERHAVHSRLFSYSRTKIRNDDGNAPVHHDFERYIDDPVNFAWDVFGVRLWGRQAEIANAVAKNSQTAAKTGHKIGKSMLAAILSFWWICTRANAKVIITAPALHQVKNVIWAELGRLHKKIRHQVGGLFPKDPLTGFHLTNENAIIGLTTDRPERIAGLSGQAVLVIVDEASGYEDSLMEALETSLAGGDDDLEGAGESKVLAIGNPTRTAGWFFEIFRTGNLDWSKHTVSSEESPNVLAANDNGGGHPVYPGLATRAFVQKWQRKCGANYATHPVYMVRIKGEYPERSSSSVIGLADVERATTVAHRERTPAAPPPHEAVLGVDVARFGDDDSVIAPRVGNHMFELEVFSGLDGPQLAAEAMRIARTFIAKGRRVRVNVDGIGVGASCVDALKHSDLAREGKMIVHDVQAGARALDPTNYTNMRAQLWFDLGVWLAEGGSLPPNDGELTRELLAPSYGIAKDGRIEVESKDDIKKTLGHSPDRADAACLAVHNAAAGVQQQSDAYSKGW